MERRVYPLGGITCRSEEGQMQIGGYAAKFHQLSVPLGGFREQILPGAFTCSIHENNIKALWNHDSNYPLGSSRNDTLWLVEDQRGLHFELDLPSTSWGKDVFQSIQRGDVGGVSFGFTVVKDTWDKSEDDDSVIRSLIEVNLIEISPTPFPAYPTTTVGVRSMQEVYEKYVNQNTEQSPSRTELLKKRLDLLAKSI